VKIWIGRSGGDYSDFDFKLADDELQKILAIQYKFFGKDHPKTIEYDLLAAEILNLKGARKKAYKLYNECMERQQRILGDGHHESLNTMWKIAYDWRIFYDELFDAAEALNQVVHSLENIFGHESLIVLSKISELGEVYAELGESKRAILILQKCVASLEKIIGSCHHETLAAIRRLANIFWSQSMLKEAEFYCAKYVDAVKKIKGKSFFDLNTITKSSLILDKYFDVPFLSGPEKRYLLPMCERLYQVRSELMGTEHNATIEAGNALALILINSEKEAEAYDILFEICDISNAKYGPLDPRKLIAQKNLALVVHSVENDDQDEGLDEDLLRDCLDCWNAPKDKSYIAIKRSLADLLEYKGQDEVVELRFQIVDEIDFGDCKITTAEVIKELAVALWFGKQPLASLEWFKRHLELACSVYGQDSPESHHSKYWLAVIYHHLGQKSTALRHLNDLEDRRNALECSRYHDPSLTGFMEELRLEIEADG
jgi:tetratricopeptide (TPR) repeat protein